MSSATLSDLIAALRSGEQVLVPNARAARELRSAFDAKQRLRGLGAWEPAQVLSWTQWTRSQWSDLVADGAETRLLLNGAQEYSLWREILENDPEMGSFGSFESLTELAMSAWELAAAYNANHRLREQAVSYDSRGFARWAEVFEQRCRLHRSLSAAQLDQALLHHLEAGTFTVPGSLQMIGFEKMLPSQAMLVARLRELGTDVMERTLEYDAHDERWQSSVVAATESEELVLAARWIRTFVAERDAQKRSARVAVLVPDLSMERSGLEEVLRETLAPELQSIESDLSSAPWEFSVGVPLSSLSMIRDALTLARWVKGPLALAEVSSLMLSPYIGHNGGNGEDGDAVARFDANRLRRMLLLRSEIEMADVLTLAESARDHASEERDGKELLGWLRSVQRLLQNMSDRARTRSFAEWMEFMRRLTQAANWPGERPLTATEFETTRAWESLLDLVSTLDFSGRRVAFETAMQALEWHARKIAFSPPPTDAAVQVMRVTEAEGCVFDAAVFLRCTDTNWPSQERLHPLLPWSLQRSLKMPGADPMQSASTSRAFTEDLMRRSGTTLFSCAAEDENGELRPSPLLAALLVKRVDAQSLVREPVAVETMTLETVEDLDELPPLPSGEVAGGAAVLKLQAACGFLAFAQMRLQATQPKFRDIGLDAGESGSLLHRALQHFWKCVVSQDALRRMTFAERDRLLDAAIDEAMPRRVQALNDWDRAYLAVQKERLRSILHRWMEEELRRGPFSVLAVEQDQLLTVGPLTLKVRMDRIDRVAHGVFFVDYKTGYAGDPKHWDGPRPDDPQLPLYALLPEAGELKGLAFAKVRTGHDMKWMGYQAEEGILPKAMVRDLISLTQEWRETLTLLAEDFAHGRAEVAPKSFEMHCTRCAQRLLCRVDRMALEAGGNRSGEEEEMEDADG